MDIQSDQFFQNCLFWINLKNVLFYDRLTERGRGLHIFYYQGLIAIRCAEVNSNVANVDSINASSLEWTPPGF